MHFRFNSNLIIVFILVCLITSCKSKGEEYGPEPVLEFVSVSSNEITEFKESLIFTIHYKDGDGDLGENDADVKNLFLTDNRIGLVYDYRVQQLAPNNTSIPITGNLKIELKTVGITDNSTQQNATFSILIIDRAGHRSNTITSGTVTIKKP